LRLGTVFSGGYFSGLEFGWTVTGVHRLLGFLGSGARNPHRILELGSQIGSVPSWQGRKIWFWAEFGQSSSEDKTKIGEIASVRGMYFYDYVVLGGYHQAAEYVVLCGCYVIYYHVVHKFNFY
jgi:hypothetical protein